MNGCSPAPGCASTGVPASPWPPAQPLFTLYTDTPERFEAAMAELDGGWTVGDTAPPQRPLIIDRITP